MIHFCAHQCAKTTLSSRQLNPYFGSNHGARLTVGAQRSRQHLDALVPDRVSGGQAWGQGTPPWAEARGQRTPPGAEARGQSPPPGAEARGQGAGGAGGGLRRVGFGSSATPKTPG